MRRYVLALAVLLFIAGCGSGEVTQGISGATVTTTTLAPVANSQTSTTSSHGLISAVSDEPGNSDSPDSPSLDLARLDGPAVQGYAAKHGVTPEQAQAIIIWQAEVAAQLDQVVRTAGPRYAGARFLPPEDNNGEAVVAIYIADPTEEDYAAVTKLDGAILVEAIAGMDQLDQIVAVALADAQAENPNSHVSVIIDPATGEVEISYEPIASSDE